MDFSNTINVPDNIVYNFGEIPVLKDLSVKSGIPISGLKARLTKAMNKVHHAELNDPSTRIQYDNGVFNTFHKGIKDLKQSVLHPDTYYDNESDEDTYDDMMAGEQAPGANMFAAEPAGDMFPTDDQFGGPDGDMGGGIDNMDLGFDDAGMESFNNVDDTETPEFDADSDMAPMPSPETEEPADISADSVNASET